jgi:hypothetical protein
MQQIEALIDDYEVSYIAVEDFFFSSRKRNGSTVNGAFRTAIHILARQRGLDYSILNISAWKTFVAGRSTPTKEQKKRWGAEPAKKLYIQDALWWYYGFRFPNHSISATTGKPIAFRYDIVDVVAQATYYCGLICGIRDIRLDVVPADDVVFKRKIKKQYVYEG